MVCSALTFAAFASLSELAAEPPVPFFFCCENQQKDMHGYVQYHHQRTLLPPPPISRALNLFKAIRHTRFFFSGSTNYKVALRQNIYNPTHIPNLKARKKQPWHTHKNHKKTKTALLVHPGGVKVTENFYFKNSVENLLHLGSWQAGLGTWLVLVLAKHSVYTQYSYKCTAAVQPFSLFLSLFFFSALLLCQRLLSRVKAKPC